MTKISVDIPPDWRNALKAVAAAAGAQSVSSYIRSLIAIELGKTSPERAWGGQRGQVPQDEQDEQLDPPKVYQNKLGATVTGYLIAPPKRHNVLTEFENDDELNPAERLAARKAAAAQKQRVVERR